MRINGLHSDQNFQLLSLTAFSQKRWQSIAKRDENPQCAQQHFLEMSELKTFYLTFFTRDKTQQKIGEFLKDIEFSSLCQCAMCQELLHRNMRLSLHLDPFDNFLSAKTFDHLTNAKTHESIRFANFLALKQK